MVTGRRLTKGELEKYSIKRYERTGMDLGIPGGCCSGQTMVGEREMKEQGWTWGFLEGVAVDRPWWRKER